MSRPSDEQLQKLGTSVREINPSTLQQDPEDGDVRWFLGDQGTELFVWSHPGKPPHHIQLVFSRVSVEWSEQRGLVTGTFSSGSSTSGGRYDQYLMHVGTVADPEVCAAAITLLGAMTVDAPVKASLQGPLQEVLDAAKPKPKPELMLVPPPPPEPKTEEPHVPEPEVKTDENLLPPKKDELPSDE